MNFQIIAVSLVASYSTYWIILQTKLSAIRVSCLLTIMCYVVLYSVDISDRELYHAVFFGGAFTGMSDRLRLGYKRLFLATLVFSLIFIFILPLFKGTGGGLGAAAFISSTAAYLINSLKNRAKNSLIARQKSNKKSKKLFSVKNV